MNSLIAFFACFCICLFAYLLILRNEVEDLKRKIKDFQQIQNGNKEPWERILDFAVKMYESKK